MTAISRADIDALQILRSRLLETRLTERARFARELDRLFSRRERDSGFESAVHSLTAAMENSIGKVAALRRLPLQLNYDPALPITAHRDDLLTALAKHNVVVLCGATGSGKTTQLPKFCLEAGRGALGLIGHTQPRRIAARAIAGRLANELGTTVGGAVGYQVRFNDRSGPDCRVKLMTDGILLKELESDRELRRYDTLIIDEAHERSLNIDLLLGVLKGVLEKRTDLKLIVTSATIDPDKFAKFFGGAPIIEVSGRSYPVEVRYRPLAGEDEDATELSLPEGVVEAVRELPRDDVLVFLPGEKQIRECDTALSKAKLHGTEILPLFSRLSTRDQERIFEGHSGRRVVLATNVAETSLTVPGIRHVIDSGLARISRYSVRGKVQRLPIEKIAKASAEQRKGRCGREAPGICIRLYGEDDFELRDEFTPPEVLRTNLASVILRLAVLGLGEPGEFPFIDPPDTRLINDGYRLLQELKAVDDNRRVTALGKQIAALPVDPRLARMLIAAAHHACLAEMLVIASFLEIQDPRERPADAQTQADQAHAVFADVHSDFIAVLNLWQAFHEKSNELSGNQLRKWCRESFLSFVRMREWQELRRQLGEAVEEIDLRATANPADYSNLHQAVLTGFLGNIGTLDEKREYLGARGSRFTIAPGTPLASKPPKWVVAGSIMETTRVFARMVAGVEPQWIERAGEHLLKRSYAEPQWVEQKGNVGAVESVSLYGLMLVGQRRINYGSVMPKEAWLIFVREALVEGRSNLSAEFMKHNAALRNQVEALEAKIRRRDILVDEQALCEFYLRRLPEHINSVALLEKWLRGGKHPATRHASASGAEFGRSGHSTSRFVGEDGKALLMSLADLTRRDTADITSEAFPDALDVDGNALALTYRFEPNQANDGATLTVPQPLLSALDAEALAWAIPGWRLEKLTALLRALPKEQRKHFVPVPDAAARCLQEITTNFTTGRIAQWIARESGQTISADQLLELSIPEYFRINIRVIALDGRLLCEGRDLAALRRASHRAQSSGQAPGPDQLHRAWEFGDLPERKTVERGGVKFAIFPALAIRGEGVIISECAASTEAEASSRRALVKLARLSLPQQAKYIQKQFTDRRDLVLLGQGATVTTSIADLLVDRVFREAVLPEDQAIPRSRGEFERRLDMGRSRLTEMAERQVALVHDILREYRTVRQKLAALNVPLYMEAAMDMQSQLAALLPEDFLIAIPSPWFESVPRYLKALQRRIDKLSANVKRDADLQRSIAPFVKLCSQFDKTALVRVELDKLRWMIEEYRVSLYAQDLKTSIPVSEKRLLEQSDKVRDEQKG